MTQTSTVLSSEEQEKRIVEMRAWLETPEGKKAMEEAVTAGERAATELAQSRKVDWRKLLRPMDF